MKSRSQETSNQLPLAPLLEAIRDSSIYGVTRAISVILGVIAIPIFARIMSPDEFGRYSLALLTITVLSRVISEWSRSSILRFDSRYKGTENYDRYASNLFIPPILLGGLIGILVASLWLIFGLFSHYDDYVIVSIIVLPFSISFALLTTLLRVRQKAKEFSLLQVLNRVGAIAVGALFILLVQMGGEGMLYGMFISLALLVPISLRWTAISKNISFGLVRARDLRKYLSYGIPLTMFALSAFLMRYTDRYMISFFRGVREVGIYSFASMFPQRTIETLIGIIALGAFPIIVREWEDNKRGSAANITSNLAKYHMLLTVPIATVLIILPKNLISVIATENFEAAYSVIPFITISSYFTSIAWFSSISFNLSTETGQLLFITIAALIINIILNLLTIPVWGYKGAAFSTMLTSMVYFGSVFSYSRKWLPWRIRTRVVFRVLGATVIAAALSYALKLLMKGLSTFNTVVIVVFYAMVYFSILQVIGELRLRKIITILIHSRS